MIEIAKLPADDRRELFHNTAAKTGLHDAIVEKDFWLCLTLDYLFHRSPWKEAVTFKGGTSLSKGYHLISRFSEDIDLILDWRVLGYGINEPWEKRSNTKQDAFNKEANQKAEVFLAETFCPQIREGLSAELGLPANLYIDKEDKQTVIFAYPNLFTDASTLQVIRLEIGALAAWTPAELVNIVPYAAEQYMETGKQEFTDALADARTVYEDELAMADEVEQAWTRLLKAAADLRLYADKDALEDLISEAEDIDLTAYTEESARAFTEALVSAKEVLADETLSEDDQSIVDEAAEALEAARGQLVAKADAEDPSGTTADPGQSSGEDGQNTADGQKTADKTAGTGSGSQTAVSGSKAVKTGDTASMAGYLLAAGAALAAAGTEVVRRKRTR